ncbi:Cytochrome P450 [Penicillium expansum]|uniref:Cytochrome P450 n=1 Tax=Penicillium expansum TaxID=27334 RepID=A0A0A2JMJ0_PENEN|nr:Cytochrome P450 [Penicillium expansum]KGO53505.1 Cytochrome P450 [Penicillium expansum]
MASASQMFFDELDRRFVPTGAQFDVMQWMKSLSYDTMGLMTFSRPYGYVQHGRDLHGIMDDVNRTNLIIGPEEHRKSAKSPSNANVDGPIADCDFLGYYHNAQERKDNVPLRFVSTWTFDNILGGADSTASMLRSVVTLTHWKRYGPSCEISNALPPGSLYLSRNGMSCRTSPSSTPALKSHSGLTLHFVDVYDVPAEGATICGHFYPGGTVVGMSPYITNRYKPTWGVDADQWRPSRLLEGEPSHTRKLEASLLSKSPGLGLSGKVHGKPMWLGPRPPARPVPECSDIVVVADIPPVPPIRRPDAVRNEPQASASTSSHLRHRRRRINELPAITLGHSVTCGCEDCRNRRFNRMIPMEEGRPELSEHGEILYLKLPGNGND